MDRFVKWFISHGKDFWGIANLLLGILIGAFIANRNQKKQWIADNKKEEYRELLIAMNKVIAAYVKAHLSGEDLSGWHNGHPEIRMSFQEVSESRLFINPVIIQMKFVKRFDAALIQLVTYSDFTPFFKEVDKLANELRNEAFKDIGV